MSQEASEMVLNYKTTLKNLKTRLNDFRQQASRAEDAKLNALDSLNAKQKECDSVYKMNEDWELAYAEKVEALSTCQDKLSNNQSMLEDLKLEFNE